MKLKRDSGPTVRPLHSSAVKLIAPLALVVGAILCTAWVSPQNYREPMKTLRQTWKRSVATVALFAFGAEQSAAQAATVPAVQRNGLAGQPGIASVQPEASPTNRTAA